VQRAKAFWAVVAGGVAEWLNQKAAIFADKGIVIFGKMFLFHAHTPFVNFLGKYLLFLPSFAIMKKTKEGKRMNLLALSAPTSSVSLPIAAAVIGAGVLIIVLFVLIPAIRKSKKP
jgi:hypothetical protein